MPVQVLDSDMLALDSEAGTGLSPLRRCRGEEAPQLHEQSPPS